MAGESLFGGIIIYHEVDTFTTIMMLPLDADETKIDSYEAAYSLLGGMCELYEIKIDEIFVRSTYQPSISVARHYASLSLKILLAGDAAHQNIRMGSCGINMRLSHAYGLG
jgi:FAD-dependent monooxygenase